MPVSFVHSRVFAGPFPAFAIAVVALACAIPSRTVAAAKDGAHPDTVHPDTEHPGRAPVPVLVELFTSEGCSSCPPADALLAHLDAKQPIPGVQVIALSEHVTYWNSLGWRDPFSSEAMTQRQQHYSAQFGLGEVYTPQVVVDGAAELVGSDERGLTRAIAKAAGQPKTELIIEHAAMANGAVRFSLKSESNAHANVFAALVQDSAESAVSHGENGGRVLHHVAVVRSLEAMGKGSADGRELTLKMPAGQTTGQATGPMHLVVFLIEPQSGHVAAIALRELKQ